MTIKPWESYPRYYPAEAKENPKYVQAQKDGKDRMEYLIGSVLRGDAAVLSHGADKYGKRNWRVDPIKATTYEAAILRHFMAYFYDGEDIDPDSGLNHLYHIRACCGIMLDSEGHGTLIDDRNDCESKGPVAAKALQEFFHGKGTEE